ncbi:hypothetical protein TNIN_329741 [Trichonephila inaurata madagascariensis]|uniref:Uncharacterized protein n=1 Tax=Trichonephila inaurata madagascariensis TaxID=2747483 RepID=A0A8X7CSP0_9ARAC|nr:hypothetical protein TNIN_329741 [Trichonephila inaurata madagascariensis]
MESEKAKRTALRDLLTIYSNNIEKTIKDRKSSTDYFVALLELLQDKFRRLAESQEIVSATTLSEEDFATTFEKDFEAEIYGDRADALGLTYTGQLIKLECGLTVVETHLGFALMGKDTKINQAKSLSTINEQQRPRSAMSMLSNQILSLDVKELWSLETIGIRDPVKNLKEREHI